MSRIGNRKLIIPEGTSVVVEGNLVTVKGPKGELSEKVSSLLNIEIENNTLITKKLNDTQEVNSLQGTANSLIENMLIGVDKGFKTELEAVGVGYKFVVQGNKIIVHASYSHPVEMIIPSGIKAETLSNTELVLSGSNKQELNEFAANIRKIRKPEPYKGKGIRYKGEHVRRKDGKKAA